MDHHGLTTSQTGLLFLGVGIGTSIGSIADCLFQTNRYKVLIKEWRGFPPPEERLYTAAVGGPLLVIGTFWLGWTGAYSSVPWYVPALSTIPLGAAINMIFVSFLVCVTPCDPLAHADLKFDSRTTSWIHICKSVGDRRLDYENTESGPRRMYAASAFAVNTMIRSAAGAAFPLFTTQMFNNVGVNNLSFNVPP
jgi:MFS transporter, DHA1 family, multidrug resistance protein